MGHSAEWLAVKSEKDYKLPGNQKHSSSKLSFCAPAQWSRPSKFPCVLHTDIYFPS